MAKSCIEHDNFFDAPEDISSESDCTSEDSEGCSSGLQPAHNVLNGFHYDFWAENPKSVDERRDAFIRQTGFVLERCQTAREGPDDAICEEIINGIDRKAGITMSDLRTKHENGKNNIAGQTKEAANEEDDLLWRIRTLKDGREFDVDEVDCDGFPKRLHEVGINKRVTMEELQRTIGSSNLVQHIMRRGPKEECDMVDLGQQQCDGGWLKRFSDKASIMFRKQRVNKKLCNYQTIFGSSSQRVRVRSHKKWSKELSCLYRKQDFLAHKGSILAMKFSLDGHYLATGAEDGSLHVWKVTEDDRSTDFDILSFSPTSTCLYFSVNGISNLASFLKIKDEGNMFNKLKNSACIMVPRKVFRILENPLHQLYGHEGEILDISWSRRGHLLSSSVDKTVRLWQVGCEQCLRIFPHNDYVTCAQFNPVDEDYFLSGSIDGIIRIWEVLECKVVGWIDIKEIVTAICYHPDGKGGIVGSMAGNCCFLEFTDNSLQPDSVIYFRGKKNVTCKRITGFQFCPSDPSKVVVSSAESQVRILKGTDVICKFRGPRPLDVGSGGSQIFASFTSDGKHIISTTDDSDVCMWNHVNDGRITNCKARNIWSCESFSSHNASIAVPWHGIKSSLERPPSSTARQHSQSSHGQFNENSNQGSQVPSGELYSSNHGITLPTCSSTAQPEEYHPKLSTTVVLPTVGKIDYGFLRNVCESILSGSSMWGLVIVTGGKDGRIRTYHNYGLPVRYPRGKSFKSSFSFSAFKKRCTENCNKLRCSNSIN